MVLDREPTRRVRRRRPVVDEVMVDDAVGTTSVVRAPWSPAQIVVLAIGSMLTLLGAVALARTGINFNDVTAQHVNVAGFHHTALLGLLEFGVGLFLIGVGAVPGAPRASMTFFGVLLLGFGIVVAASPVSFHAGLGTHSGHGFLYMISGVVLLVTAMVAPVFFDRDSRAYSRRSDVIERETY
jgi:hypothetical protein